MGDEYLAIGTLLASGAPSPSAALCNWHSLDAGQCTKPATKQVMAWESVRGFCDEHAEWAITYLRGKLVTVTP